MAGHFSLFVRTVRKLRAKTVVHVQQSFRISEPALYMPTDFPTLIILVPQFLHLFHILVLTVVMSVSPE